jgi:hypothetical protein
VVREWPHDEATPEPDLMGAWIDFGSLERIIERSLDAEERLAIATAAWRCYSAHRPMTWRAWERMGGPGIEGVFRYMKRDSAISPPSERTCRGPRGYPEFKRMILFLHGGLRLGSYTTRESVADEGAGTRDVNVIDGRFVRFMAELVLQLRRLAPPGLFPPGANIGRHIKHVLESTQPNDPGSAMR